MSEFSTNRPEAKQKPSDDFSIEVVKYPDHVTIKAALGDRYQFPPREEYERYELTDEDWADMDPDEQAAEKAYDPEAEYRKEMAKAMEEPADMKGQCDLLADELAAAKGLMSPLSNEARAAFTSLTDLLHKATTVTTPAMYADLPAPTKLLLEYADRLVQLYHMRLGSTHTTPMDKVYSEEESAQCIDGFVSGIEQGLAEGLSASGTKHNVEIQRPDRLPAITMLSKLGFKIIEQTTKDPSEQERIWDSMLHASVKKLTETYRQDPHFSQ